MVTIKIIIGSGRPGRFGAQPARWLFELSKQYKDTAKFELVDLQELGLPFLNESAPASAVNRDYDNELTKKWSQIVSVADGFIFISPEYNHSYSPYLKNAIDYLYSEWHHKPVSFFSYGSAVGGAYGVEHLRNVVSWLKMYDLSDQVSLPHYYADLDEEGNFMFDDTHERHAKNVVEQTIFWAEAMKPAREKLQKVARA